MRYQAKLVISIPTQMLDVARQVSRAFDPDDGGAYSYRPRHAADAQFVIDVDGVVTYTSEPLCWVADAPCTADFATQAMYLVNNPAALHAAVVADYTARWQDFTPPTITECEAFCASAVISTE